MTLILLFLALFPAGRRIAPASAAPNPQHVVQRAWEWVRQAGSYSFTAQVDQVSIPLPLPANVGRHSQQQSAHLEGTTNLAERKMDFTLNSTGGSVLDKKSGTEIKIEGDQAYSRQGQQAWQKIDDFTGAFAPQSDFLAFLAGARDIRLAEPAGEKGVARYTFAVDGPGFAAYKRDGMIQQLTSQGKLPIGVEVNISEALASLTGTGEIWIAADGLPVRQVLHLQFPLGSADQVQADVQVNFRDFGPLPAAPPAQLSLPELVLLELVHNAIHSPAFRDFCLAARKLLMSPCKSYRKQEKTGWHSMPRHSASTRSNRSATWCSAWITASWLAEWTRRPVCAISRSPRSASASIIRSMLQYRSARLALASAVISCA